MLAKTAEYAMRAVAALAAAESAALPAGPLAEKTRIPRRYLHKVMQELTAAGLVTSRPGPGGGYTLCRQPQEITLLDVVNAVAPLERIRECPLGLPGHTSLCPLHQELDRVIAATEEAFSKVTLGELLASTGKVIPLCDAMPQLPCRHGELSTRRTVRAVNSRAGKRVDDRSE